MTFDLLTAQRRVFESNVSPQGKLVLLALLDHWSRGSETFPSVKRLAAWTSLSARQVIRELAALEHAGAIRVQRETGRSNRYDLRPVLGLPQASDRCPPVTGDHQSPVTDSHRCPPVTSDHQSPHPCLSVTGVVTDSHPKEPNKEPNKEPRDAAPARARAREGRPAAAAAAAVVEVARAEVAAAATPSLAERARGVLANPHDGQFQRPSQWPEVRAVARAWSAPFGIREPKLRDHAGSDSDLRAILEAFSDGYSVAELERAGQLAASDEWFARRKRPGPAAFTAAVIRRLLAGEPDSARQEAIKRVEAPGGLLPHEALQKASRDAITRQEEAFFAEVRALSDPQLVVPVGAVVKAARGGGVR